MGSWNFSEQHLTDWSYQLTDLDEDDNSYTEYVENEITSKIEELIAKKPYFDITSKFYLGINLEDISKEHGYYDGVRLEPTFVLELCHEDTGEVLSVTMEYDNHKDNTTRSYMEFLHKFIEDHFDNLVMTDDLEIQNFFYEVNNIMLEYCVPYSVGWTASALSDPLDAVCLMHPIMGSVRMEE